MVMVKRGYGYVWLCKAMVMVKRGYGYVWLWLGMVVRGYDYAWLLLCITADLILIYYDVTYMYSLERKIFCRGSILVAIKVFVRIL